MWPPEREHTQKLSNEDMVHNCLLAPNNLGRRVTREGNKYHIYFSSSAADRDLRPDLCSNLPLSTPGTWFSSWITTHRLWKNYCFVLVLPGVSKLTHDFSPVKQPDVSVQVSSCIESFLLQGGLGAAPSPCCDNSTARVHHRATKAEPRWTKQVNADALHGVLLATYWSVFFCLK